MNKLLLVAATASLMALAGCGDKTPETTQTAQQAAEKVTGKVQEVLVKEGDLVQEGQRLQVRQPG